MVLILFFLGALVGSTASAQVLAPSQPSQQQRLFAGTINADTVWLDEYSREVGRLTEMATQRVARLTRRTSWNRLGMM
ncbi:MAG: hypothetical protein IPF59_03310 [Ignavibacteria bacterium]|nr:hypothetical protein [Ignavibacteria bacterium]